MIQKAPTETGCGDFNDNNTLKFISLNVWSPVGKTVWEGSQEGMRLGTDSEVSKVELALCPCFLNLGFSCLHGFALPSGTLTF